MTAETPQPLNATHRPGAAATRVTTIDIWKTVALVLILVDHIGHYLLPDENWWRVVGRSSLPLWFFLIGYAGGRGVPWKWLGLGLCLTMLDLAREGSLTGGQFNILFNFAAIRLALPLVEGHVWPQAWRISAFFVVAAVLASFIGPYVEYGAEGWALDLVGVAHRRWLDRPDASTQVIRIALAVAAGTLFVVVEKADYSFDMAQTIVLAFLIAAISLALVGFRRADLDTPLAPPLAGALRFCGRHSLILYAGQIIVLTALAWIFQIAPPDQKVRELVDDGAEQRVAALFTEP